MQKIVIKLKDNLNPKVVNFKLNHFRFETVKMAIKRRKDVPVEKLNGKSNF